MSESNPNWYGERYIECSACGVKIPPSDIKDGRCSDAARCERVKKSVDQACRAKPMLEAKK